MGLLNNLRDPVTVLRASGADEYGNPAASWDAPVSVSAFGFLASRSVLIMAPSADVRAGDRVVVSGETFAVDGEPELARSPSAAKALIVRLAEFVEGG